MVNIDFSKEIIESDVLRFQLQKVQKLGQSCYKMDLKAQSAKSVHEYMRVERRG